MVKNMKLLYLLAGLIGISLFYFSFTRSESVFQDLSKESISEIVIYAYLPDVMKEPEYITISDTENIDRVVSLLDNYELKKKIKLKNLISFKIKVYPANSDPFIQLWLYGDSMKQINIRPNNAIEMHNKNQNIIEYRTTSSDKSVFFEMSRYIGEHITK